VPRTSITTPASASTAAFFIFGDAQIVRSGSSISQLRSRRGRELCDSCASLAQSSGKITPIRDRSGAASMIGDSTALGGGPYPHGGEARAQGFVGGPHARTRICPGFFGSVAPAPGRDRTMIALARDAARGLASASVQGWAAEASMTGPDVDRRTAPTRIDRASPWTPARIRIGRKRRLSRRCARHAAMSAV